MKISKRIKEDYYVTINKKDLTHLKVSLFGPIVAPIKKSAELGLKKRSD